MGVNGLQWSTLSIPLAAGINTKGDARAGNPPQLDICTDAQFDEVGGLQTRYPFAAISNSIFGGGTLSNVRKLAVNGDELIAFTKDSLYSWSPQRSAWVLKGTHLAIELAEQTVFATTGDQHQCDRAELNGTAVYVWNEAGILYAAARDTTTGAVLMAPTVVSVGSTGLSRPRVVATSTKILLFYRDGAGSLNLQVKALDPADPATGLAAAPTTVYSQVSGFDEQYDVTRVSGADQVVGCARLNPTTSHLVFTVTAGLVVATSVKARASADAMAIACTADGTIAAVVRGSPIASVDQITISTLADTANVNALIGGSFAGGYNVTAAFRSTTDGGAYRCYVFGTGSEPISGVYNSIVSTYGWVDTAGNVGGGATFVRQGGIGSRAFEYDGHVYVWLAFGSTSGFSASGVTSGASWITNVQNNYFLYRDDAFLCGKAVYNRGGGIDTTYNGHLPGVALTSGSTFAWCAIERRRVEIGGGTGGGVSGSGSAFAMRAPHEVTFTFDSNAARRGARIGQTYYVACGEGVLQYDGRQLVETGFHVAPWFVQLATGGAGNLAVGTYAYKPTWRWLNARGETDRSTSGVIGNVAITTSAKNVQIDAMYPCTFTHKGNAPAYEVWRTAVDPTADAPFYLVTNPDPAQTSNPNRYLANDASLSYLPQSGGLPDFILDAFDDATATTKETNPESGTILENLAPPACSIIMATADRLFLAGIAGDPDRVWYSKLRADGQVVSFHDALTINVPPEGGLLRGMCILNETLIVFRERAIYAFPGDGYANDGSGGNYGPARLLSVDLGAVNHESIAVIEQGAIFKSSKGWYVLNRGWGLDYIGAAVSDYDAEEPLAAHVVSSRHQVRLLTASRMLVWDYFVNQWSVWTIADGLDAVLWRGTYHYLTSTGPKAEQATHSGVDYGMDIETPWIKLDDLQGFGRVRRVLVLGEYASAHRLRIRIARDYKATALEVWDYFDDQYWDPSPTTIGGPEQVRIGPSQQQCQSIKIRISATGAEVAAMRASGTLEPTGSDTFTLGTVYSSVVGAIGNTRSLHFDLSGSGAGSYQENFDGTATYYYEPFVTTIEDVISTMSGVLSLFLPLTGSGTINRFEAGFTIALSGGADAYYPDAPSGEALKLTGLALEIGQKRGPYRMLPSAQKI